MSIVILRPFDPDKEAAMLGQYYPNAVWYGLPTKPDMTKAEFFKIIRASLLYSDVHIACMQDDPDTILGFSVIRHGILDYVFVKPHVRKEGIATLLTKGKYHVINSSYVSKIGQSILKKQGERNGTKEETSQGVIGSESGATTSIP